mmetsp:Transcript_13528/g.34022  ORF Transcript_13528/g.34022 Transcript_13528/m.34022 type:complete len:545 (-) Transcript_13528:163-1797(-)
MLSQEDKRCVRAVIRQIHPDKFSQHPEQQAVNSESLKVLNAFLERCIDGEIVRSSRLQFWTIDDSSELKRVCVEISGPDSLYALFDSFGVEHSGKKGSFRTSHYGSQDFVTYLKQKVSEADALSRRFQSLSSSATQFRADLIKEHGLQDLRFQDVIRDSCSNVVWQISALQLLSDCLESLDEADRLTFTNQRIVLHRTRKRPSSKSLSQHSQVLQGSEIHLVVNRTLKSQLRKIDAKLLGNLSRLNAYWTKRIKHLVPAAKSVLNVRSILGDFVYSGDGCGESSSLESAVLWTGKVLRASKAFRFAFENQDEFSYSILVHSDHSTPFIEMGKSGTMLQVRSDCPPSALLAFMCSPESRAFNREVGVIEARRSEEAFHLQKVKKALKAKQVIRVCSFEGGELSPFYDACERLIVHAKDIARHVDLKGVSLAIDDCYELWESGFISIPYDFEVETLCANLQKSLPLNCQGPPGLLKESSKRAVQLPATGSSDTSSSSKRTSWFGQVTSSMSRGRRIQAVSPRPRHLHSFGSNRSSRATPRNLLRTL